MNGGTATRAEFRARARTLCVCVVVAVAGVLAAGPVAAQEEVSAVLTAGKAALEDGLYPLAEKKFRECLDRRDGTAAEKEEAALLLARALHEQGKYKDIQDVLQTGLEWVKKAPDGSGFFYWRALAMYEAGDMAGACAEIDRLEAKSPSIGYTGKAQRLKGWCRLKQGRTNEALAAFEKFDRAEGSSPEAPDNLLDWGRALLEAGRIEEAQGIFSRLTKMSPEHPAVLQGRYWFARTLVEGKKWKEAEALLKPLIENPTATGDLRAEASYAQAAVCQGLTNMPQALAALSNGIERAKSPGVKCRGGSYLGSLLIDMGRVDEGIRVMKTFVAATPNDPLVGQMQITLAGALLDRGKSPEAVGEFQHYLETFTNEVGQAQAYHGRAQGLMNLKRYAEAATAFGKAAELMKEPEARATCLFKAGDACFANAQYKLAADIYRRVPDEFPKSPLVPKALFQLGESLARSAKPDEAQSAFMKIAEQSPTHSLAGEGLLRIAEIKESAGNWREAIDVYGKVMSTQTNTALAGSALLGRAMVRYRQFMSSEALADFEQLVARYPGTETAEQAFYMRGMCHYRMLGDKDALAIWTEFIKQHPQSKWAPAVLFWMGKYYYNQGQYEEAERQFMAVAEKYKGNPLQEMALLRAGYAALRRNEYVRANELLSRLIKELPESQKLAEARLIQGEALSQLGNYPAAILSFEEIINKQAGADIVPLAWSRKGYCQFMLGGESPKRYEEAINSYRVVINDPNVQRIRPDLVFEAEYMMGRCLQKLKRVDDALDEYYAKVMIRFLTEREKNVWHSEASKMWFSRAAFNAADILEERKEWRKVINVLERVIDAGIPVSDEIKEKMKKIKAEHWLLF